MTTIQEKYIGLGKTKFNSSACYVFSDCISDSELILTERINRKKASGVWPLAAIKKIILDNNLDSSQLAIAENSDVYRPIDFENELEKKTFFFKSLEVNGLQLFTSHFNSNIEFVTHHVAHAYSALATSPFSKSIIVILDGAGTRSDNFPDLTINLPKASHEECSVYLQDGASLKLVMKRWINIDEINSIGALYEKASEFIFNSSTSSGKVMGLAPFGRVEAVGDIREYFTSIDQEKSFNLRSKKEWENSPHLQYYKNIAATVQFLLEKNYEQLILELKNKFPEYDNLILAGGCAMNCTNNAVILKKKIFDSIYISPFPGDESISFGLAHYLRLKDNPGAWAPLGYESQNLYLGPKSSKPDDKFVLERLKFHNISYEYYEDIVPTAVNDLLQKKIIGWFQGRSESGPRALGNRSILARPDQNGLKDRLNNKIKNRENFRPYGCSSIKEKAFEYFEIDQNFNNPFMSYAINVRSQYKESLREVSHVDGTSRMQITTQGQNHLFHRLIFEFGNKSNLYCLLNTSMNIMGEPIVETIDDAIRFFNKTEIHSMYIGNFKLIKNLSASV